MKPNPGEILMISYLDYPYPAGLSTRIDGLAGILTRNGVKVNILAPITRRGLQDRNRVDKCSVERVDLRRFGARSAAKFGTKILQLILFSIIASFKVAKRTMQRHTLIQYQSLYSAIPALFAKILLRARIIGDDIVLINPFIDTPVLRLSDVVVTASPQAYAFAKRLRKHALYVPNGIRPQPVKKSSLALKPKILFVGSLSFSQNLKATENIIRIASILEKKGLMFQITIVGGPLSYAAHLINHPIVKTGKVKFAGIVSSKKLAQLYSSSSIGLLPFFKDTPLTGGQRTKALEFFANQLLVMSGPEGIKGISGLEAGKHYLLANSLVEMSEILKKSILHPEQYRRIAGEGARHISEDYSWEAVSKNYVNLIRALTARSYDNIRARAKQKT